MKPLLCLLCLGLAPFAQAEEAYQSAVKVEPLLKTGKDGAGRVITYPTDKDAELIGVRVEIPPGKETGWHVHTLPCMAYVLEGEVTVEWQDGSKHKVKAGEAFAEVVNLKHNGRNEGKVPARLIMFVAGSKDTPVAEKQS